MKESTNLDVNETNSIIELISDRTQVATGGFAGNWDAEVSSTVNKSPTPFKLISYKLRVFTTKPCIIWSAFAENYRVAVQAASGVDTSFNQRSMANGLIKKWTQTVDGGYWSFLEARPKGKSGRGPQKVNDAVWKLQIKNIDPAGQQSNFFAITEFTIDYDATSVY